MDEMLAAGAATNEFLTLRLGNEEYGVEILKVQEIRGCDAVTAIAHAPDFLRGVIDLRGIIVPIVDMRIKFGLASAEYNEFTVVIILMIAARVVGIVVDGVSDVVTLQPDEIRPIPELGSAVDTRYILGIGKRAERMVILLDIERLMTSPEMQLIEAASAA